MRSGTRADNFADNEMHLAPTTRFFIMVFTVCKSKSIYLKTSQIHCLRAAGISAGPRRRVWRWKVTERAGSRKNNCDASSDLNRGFRFTVF